MERIFSDGEENVVAIRPASRVTSPVEPVSSSCVSDRGASADKLNVAHAAWSMSAVSLHESPLNEAF